MERYRIFSDGAVYFVTYSVVHWLPVFVSAEACRAVTNSLNFCHAHKGLRVHAYVIMPTHLHAIVYDVEFCPRRLEQTLWDMRKFTGRTLVRLVAARLPKCFSQAMHLVAGTDRTSRFWQSSQHPVQIETDTFCQQKADYLHENPVRKGLVRRAKEWRFSSSAYWESDGEDSNDVILSAVKW